MAEPWADDEQLLTTRLSWRRPAPWRAARAAVAALVGWAVIGVLGTVIAVGHYEDQITVVTHGDVDVLPAWLVYTYLDHVMPSGMVTTVAAGWWILGLLVAGVAVITWLVAACRRAGHRGGAPAWRRWWVGVVVTVLLHLLVALYAVLTSSGGVLKGEALDTRLVAYPLWTAGTVALVATAVLGARAVLRITEAQLSHR